MLADHYDAQTRGAQDARNQLRKLAITEHTGLAVRADIHLFEDLARRGHWLGEHGCIIGNGAGHTMQIHDRQRQEFREGAVVAHNPQYAAARAVRRNAAPAIAAHFRLPKTSKPQSGAVQLDFSDDAAPDPALVSCAGDAHDIAHEFVAKRAVKVVIAAQDFNIRVADSRQAHADQRPAGLQSWLRLLHERKTISASDGGEHQIFGGLQVEPAPDFGGLPFWI